MPLPQGLPPIQTSTKSPGDIANLLRKMDLEVVLLQLTFPIGRRGQGWPVHLATKALGRYRRFLLLKATSGRLIVPTVELDTIWHVHLMDTQKYMNDCIETFGFFLHHFPYLGMRGEADVEEFERLFQETTTLYQERFHERYDFSEIRQSSDGGGNCG